MWVALALLVLEALLVPRRSAASRGEQPPAVPSPMQTVVTSENFKTVLHWQYPSTSETPHFIVEIKPYNPGRYEIVSTCANISAHSCDLSREIDKPLESHWFRVKAVVGSQQSEYVETDEFILRKHGKIGPPKLSLSRDVNKIVVNIYHPAFPSVERLPWIKEIYSDLTYSVTFRDSENKSKQEFHEVTCTIDKCNLNISVPTEGSTYCVSAKGTLEDYVMFGAPSEETCIHVPLKQTLSTIDTFILCGVILGVSLILIVSLIYVCKNLRKNNIKLPKSLVTVIRNLNTDTIVDSRSEARYTSVISFMSGQSALPLNGEVTSLEVEPEDETVSPDSSREGASSVPPPESPAKTEEVFVQEGTEEIPTDDEHNHQVKETYVISDSGQMDTFSNSSGADVSATEICQTVIPSSCPKFSGYDKPHVPLDMLVDVGEEQPVKGYRLTD
ncbi:interferon gamma receptor 1 isoform X1 [Columba livia]|uniref:interferon gamma receptor 1 isoform X1 n=2 Tax=Columba livia TaxID=8932 RepID=UPI0031BA6569